jgi:hypothetical protein
MEEALTKKHTLEKRFQGLWRPRTLTNYYWTLVRNAAEGNLKYK